MGQSSSASSSSSSSSSSSRTVREFNRLTLALRKCDKLKDEEEWLSHARPRLLRQLQGARDAVFRLREDGTGPVARRKGWTLLHHAVLYAWDLEIVRIVSDRSEQCQAPELEKMMAIEEEEDEKEEEKGKVVNVWALEDEDGNTPLMLAGANPRMTVEFWSYMAEKSGRSSLTKVDARGFSFMRRLAGLYLNYGTGGAGGALSFEQQQSLGEVMCDVVRRVGGGVLDHRDDDDEEEEEDLDEEGKSVGREGEKKINEVGEATAAAATEGTGTKGVSDKKTAYKQSGPGSGLQATARRPHKNKSKPYPPVGPHIETPRTTLQGSELGRALVETLDKIAREERTQIVMAPAVAIAAAAPAPIAASAPAPPVATVTTAAAAAAPTAPTAPSAPPAPPPIDGIESDFNTKNTK